MRHIQKSRFFPKSKKNYAFSGQNKTKKNGQPNNDRPRASTPQKNQKK